MTSPAAMQEFARANVQGRDLNSDAFPLALWRAMGEAGRRRAVEHFGWDAIARRTVDLYESLVRG